MINPLVSYNTLIGAYSSAGLHDEAVNFFILMKESGHRPNIITYTSLVNAYGKAGQPEKAEEIFEMVRRKNLKLGVVVYNALINAYSVAGKLDDAMRIFIEMKSKMIHPNSVTICTLLIACRKGRHIEKTQIILKEAAIHNIELDTAICNSALTVFIEGGAYEAANDLYLSMQAESICPDEITYGLLIRISGALGDHMQARKYYDEMSSGAHGLSVEATSAMIDIYAKKVCVLKFFSLTFQLSV